MPGFEDFILPAAASAFGSFMSRSGTEESNQMNAEQAQLNRDFQERMSDTAYQRAVADLQKAGLNPMLAYSQGGASSPPGSMPAPMQSAKGAGVEGAVKGMSTALQAAQVSNTDANTEKAKAEAELARTQAQAIPFSANYSAAQTDNLRQDMKMFEDKWSKLQIENKKNLYDVRVTEGKLKAAGYDEKQLPEVQAAQAEAQKLANQARLLGLEIPKAVQEAAFFKTAAGARAIEFKHAPDVGHFGTGAVMQGGDVLQNAASRATSAFKAHLPRGN